MHGNDDCLYFHSQCFVADALLLKSTAVDTYTYMYKYVSPNSNSSTILKVVGFLQNGDSCSMNRQLIPAHLSD